MRSLLNTSLHLIIYVYLLFSVSCRNNPENIIVVLGDARDVQSYETILSSQTLKIGLINPARPDKPVRILTDNFISACSPEVSFDGKSMIFAGRKDVADPWQIWEMDLNNSKVRNVSPGDENCLYPAYLPGSQVVYSKTIIDDSLRSSLSLFKSALDGTGEQRITFTPSAWYASTTLADGRILTKCSKDGSGEPDLMVLRPDGTKAELFCKPPHKLTGCKAVETHEGLIAFTGKEPDGSDLELLAVSYNNPFNRTYTKSDQLNADFLSVSSAASGKMLVCYRNNPGEKYRLGEFDNEEGVVRVVYENTMFDVVEAVLTGEKAEPRKLPSEVDKLVKTGLLLCQDVNFPGGQKISKIEVEGVDNSSYGTFEPEADGSFYLKVIADMPFRLKTYDDKGEIVDVCNWMSLRPNERRGCTGCHEDPQVVPENRIPLAVKKSPVIIPVTLEEIEEKIIELE